LVSGLVFPEPFPVPGEAKSLVFPKLLRDQFKYHGGDKGNPYGGMVFYAQNEGKVFPKIHP